MTGITTVHWPELAIVGSAAGLLSLLYYGGLWLTVQQLLRRERATSSRPGQLPSALFVSASFVLRTVLVIAGFYWVTGGQLLPLLVALVAFITVRSLLLHGSAWVHEALRE